MQKKLLQSAMLGAGATALAVLLWSTGVLDKTGVENATWTWRVRSLWKPSPTTSRVKLVVIDQESLDWAAKENNLPWPWMRQAYNPVLDFLRKGGANVIAFDMLYSEPGNVEDDETFGAKIGEKTDYVSGFFTGSSATQTNHWPEAVPRPAWKFEGMASDWPAEKGATFPIRQVASNAAMLASVKEDPDSDGLYRRVTPLRYFDGQPIPMLGMAAWLNFQPLENRVVTEKDDVLIVGNARLALDAKKRVLLRFRGQSGTHTKYTAAAIIRSQLQIEAGEKPQIDPSVFKDCYVFFGVTAPGLMDLKPTPVSGNYPGVEIHATFLDNLLEGDFLRDVPPVSAAIFSLLLAIAAAAGTLWCRNGIQTALSFAGSIATVLALGFGAYDRGFWWPMMLTATSLLVAQVAAVVFNYLTEGKQKRFIKSAFNQMVGAEVLDEITRDPSKINLGGERRVLTMFFSDLEKFSSFSEKMSPEQLIEMLNEFLTEMGEVIKAERGYVDKYIGDAIVGIWNAPVLDSAHALNCVRAAVLCQRRIAVRRDEWLRRFGANLKMRIGINTGEVSIGMMGSQAKKNYTMLGDAANLASRLEGANKAFGTFIMVAEATWRLLNGAVPGREIGLIRVVGRAAPVRVFEPMGMPGDKMPTEFECYATAIQLVREKKWAEAYEHFEDVSGDPLSEKYAAQCLALRDGKLPDWDGVWNLTEKG